MSLTPFGAVADTHLDIGVDMHPISQTPCQSLRHKHFIIAIIINIISTFWINFGLAVAVMSDSDRVGLWESFDFAVEDQRRYYYLSSPLYVDLILTAFLVAFFLSFASGCGNRSALLKGDALPIPAQELRPWRFFGVTITSSFLRSIYLGAVAVATIFPITLGFLALSCEKGSMYTYTPPGATKGSCYLNTSIYKWMKASWCGCIALVLYPLVEMGTLNRDTLSDEDYNAFIIANELKHGSHQSNGLNQTDALNHDNEQRQGSNIHF